MKGVFDNHKKFNFENIEDMTPRKIRHVKMLYTELPATY